MPHATSFSPSDTELLWKRCKRILIHNQNSMVKNGTPAPAFSLPSTDGKTVSLSDFSGKPTVILFYRGWFCPTSRRSLSAWQDFSRSAKDLGFAIVAISTAPQDVAAQFSQDLRITIPLLSDPSVDTARAYGAYINDDMVDRFGVFSEPALFLVDSEGNIAYYVISSGPKGMPEPGAVSGVMIYMSKRNGKY